MHQAAEQWVGIINGQLVCHTGIIQFPMRKGWKRVHRLVVLPDYQGIGIGTKFINEIAKYYKNKGKNVNLTTTTPSLVHSLKKQKDWVLIRYGRETSGQRGWERYGKGVKTKHLGNAHSGKRITFSFNFREW